MRLSNAIFDRGGIPSFFILCIEMDEPRRIAWSFEMIRPQARNDAPTMSATKPAIASHLDICALSGARFALHYRTNKLLSLDKIRFRFYVTPYFCCRLSLSPREFYRERATDSGKNSILQRGGVTRRRIYWMWTRNRTAPSSFPLCQSEELETADPGVSRSEVVHVISLRGFEGRYRFSVAPLSASVAPLARASVCVK